MGDSPDTPRRLAVVPSIRIEDTTASLRGGCGAPRTTFWCRVGRKAGQKLGCLGHQAGFGQERTRQMIRKAGPLRWKQRRTDSCGQQSTIAPLDVFGGLGVLGCQEQV